MVFDIICFGSAVRDIFVDTNISVRKNFLSYPIGRKILIRDLKLDIGGGGINTSVGFARLGLKTGYLGKIGDDESSKDILKLLKKEKITFLGKQKKQGNIDYSIILDSKKNRRTILNYKEVSSDFGIDEINFSKIRTKWIYFSSLLGKSFETQKKLADELSKRGVKIVFNPSEYLIKKKDIQRILKLCDVLILNKEEAKLIIKKGDLFEGLNKLGAKLIVITDGSNEIKCYDGKKKYFLKPSKIRIVEKTGAGDAFSVGFTAGLIKKKSIEWCLRFGLKESQAVMKHYGAKNNLIRMKLK